jgi:hypothetical protein
VGTAWLEAPSTCLTLPKYLYSRIAVWRSAILPSKVHRERLARLHKGGPPAPITGYHLSYLSHIHLLPRPSPRFCHPQVIPYMRHSKYHTTFDYIYLHLQISWMIRLAAGSSSNNLSIFLDFRTRGRTSDVFIGVQLLHFTDLQRCQYITTGDQ